MVAENESTLRMRSIKSGSVDQFEGDTLLLKSLLNIRPDKPCHKLQDSLFSSSSGFVDYRGVINFTVILLVLSNVHIALENIKKYGNLYNPAELYYVSFYSTTESLSSLFILLGFNVFALCSLGIEILLSKGLLSGKLGLMIITSLLTSEIVIPAILLYLTDCFFATAGAIAFLGFIFCLKLVSYHITNYWCRETHDRTQKIRKLLISQEKIIDTGNSNTEKNLVKYPDNLNLKDLFYYLYVPTLCYELNFPRSGRIRKMFLFKRVLEIAILSQINIYLFQQCLLPIYNDAVKDIQEMDFYGLLEIYLKFSVPHMAMALTSFYMGYHSFFNALAEILRFGDRYFYCAFWNSGKIMDFWQNWSIPVHKFILRHVYLPIRQCGFTQYQSLTAAFLVSACGHEYVFGVCLKVFRLWSFLIMLVQVPYILFLDKFLNEKYGNAMCYVFFFIALPFYSLMYYKDYYVENYQNAEAAV